MRYLFMDNQLNSQEPVSKQTPVVTDPIPDELAVQQTPPEPVAPVINPEPIPPEPKIETTPESNEYEQILNQYAASQQTESPIQENPNPTPTEPTLSDFGIAPKPPQNNIFKIFFIIALIIFVLVATDFAFVYFKSKQTTEPTTTTNTLPTSVPTGICTLNDKTYNVGDSFIAADNCNTCTCNSANVINCTSNKCMASSTATKSAILTATPTATSTSSAIKK